ncbi:hypothetical protein [Bradyrhizobium sp. CCBAU 21359]|uniref:hypothetical protein n=1 Tax=Bradyrhizobium sp. CCBAU 21359 TaxID=1325080 RepID=UPI00230537CD|nr:hypothetical protein [Bradyrhizobium sp. CCBAU 21359]
MSRTVVDAKTGFLKAGGHVEALANFTIDSPVPFRMETVLGELNRLNAETGSQRRALRSRAISTASSAV